MASNRNTFPMTDTLLQDLSDESNESHQMCASTSHGQMWTNEDSSNENVDEYEDEYGTTPPRTRILRRNRERKQRDCKDHSRCVPGTRLTSKRLLNRRNTVSSTNTFNELLARAEHIDSGKRANKRSIKILRGSERDLKLDITSAQLNAINNLQNKEKVQPLVQIEGCKRFMCLESHRVAQTNDNVSSIPDKPPIENGFSSKDEGDSEKVECPQNRIYFHKFLSKLVRMGCGEKSVQERHPRRHISREEYLWQTKLNDLIWLELQAWHADRTREEEDIYLCNARKSVEDLINDIMTYRFVRHKQYLSTQSDSGIEEDCSGCLAMTCQSCLEAQNEALSEVEKLLSRLEEAESLFSSSKALGQLYPVYNSPEFVGRVKAMCQWYNLTKLQLLKIIILSKMLTLEEKLYVMRPSEKFTACESPELGSPFDSNGSTSSLNGFTIFKISTILTSIRTLVDGNSSKPTPYRKYIENMLKTKGLMKSVTILENLHQHLLRKINISLRKPNNEDVFTKTPTSEDEELERYGVWSVESKALSLPSYKAAFMFLCYLPLKVIKEFLCMRLEQKPDNPSPLSVRQLLRELKEGILVATRYRQRVLEYMNVVFGAYEIPGTSSDKEEFDKNLYGVFEVYLEYVEQWALLEHDTFQKSLLEEEWKFSCEIIQYIEGGSDLAGRKFCRILKLLLESIGERLLGSIEECAATLQLKQDDIVRKQSLFSVCRELQQIFNEERDWCVKTVAFTKNVFKHADQQEHWIELKMSIISFNCTIPNAIEKVQTIFDMTIFEDLENLDEQDKLSLISRSREILHQGYRFGFEYYKVMSDLIPVSKRQNLFRSMVVFANLWMKFAQERCERGRGIRPRWASHGLEFLLLVCDPHHTLYLTDEEFEALQTSMDSCISHVIGGTSGLSPDSGVYSSSPRTFPRSRGSSPSPRASYRNQRSLTRKTSTEKPPIYEQLDDSPNSQRKSEVYPDICVQNTSNTNCTPIERIRDSVEVLNNRLDKQLRELDLIGRVIKCTPDPLSKAQLKRRYVKFTWQRGIKIGQGRFGKVFTAVNNNTGEMMAVKEIALQHNDKYTISKVAEELKILEGISHQHLVKYFGLEIHKEEMLIFMEFCAEGTLESLVAGTENGLPELLIRRYTYQLLLGVAELHSHGIVHRDIKSANIFLTDQGNCLKIGDFGCATKIKANTTLPGELIGFVGTQAYMAPEVFMKTNTAGHGRAADVWSVGCVVIEMASGKRPWADYDSNYQIMFKVGMGKKPEPPEYLIDEGHEFLEHCLQHDPKDRATAAELLDHNFVKIGDDY